MKVILDDGTEFAAKFAHAPTLSGDCAIEIRSAGGKRVSEIAKLFDRQKKIIKRDENEGDAEYIGYTTLYLIRQNADGSVTMFLRKGETA